MKIWTQEEYERAGTLTGTFALGTGDFRHVDFGGRARVVIGPHSILGKGARLGVQSEVGDHSEIGADFRAGPLSRIGAYCHFGRGAHIGADGSIGRRTAFAPGCKIDKGTELGDHIDLPDDCELFGCKGVLGETLLKLAPVDERTLYAFASLKGDEATVYVSMPGMLRTLDEFEAFAADLVAAEDLAIRRREGRQILAAAKYLRTRFAIEELCALYGRLHGA